MQSSIHTYSVAWAKKRTPRRTSFHGSSERNNSSNSCLSPLPIHPSSRTLRAPSPTTNAWEEDNKYRSRKSEPEHGNPEKQRGRDVCNVKVVVVIEGREEQIKHKLKESGVVCGSSSSSSIVTCTAIKWGREVENHSRTNNGGNTRWSWDGNSENNRRGGGLDTGAMYRRGLGRK
ncbi:hypothetical protein B0H12DRAFT_29661 [Mycena haematopus]|nr:hypothetical protein B0H12DRAFT_29661 [Mycena haematopus]